MYAPPFLGNHRSCSETSQFTKAKFIRIANTTFGNVQTRQEVQDGRPWVTPSNDKLK